MEHINPHPNLAPRDVQTTLNYYVSLDTTQPAYRYYCDPPPGVAMTNVGKDTRPMVIHDARDKMDEFSLDVNGFQFVHYPSVEKDFDDEDKIKRVYFAEAEGILKKYAGAKRVLVFHHTIRRSVTDQGEHLTLPLHRAHVDHTPATANKLVKDCFGDEAERLLKGRYRIINVWRPIENTVAHNPLAVADYRSVDPDNDLVSTRLINADNETTTFNAQYNPTHKWYYLSDQTPDEVTLIKCYDSDIDKARYSPHSAFRDSTSPADAPQRQSIEVRALVFDTE